MADDPTPPVRNLFLTKTAAAQYITTAAGLVAVFYPPATEIVAAHAGQILIGLGIANLIIRSITHGKVEIFPS